MAKILNDLKAAFNSDPLAQQFGLAKKPRKKKSKKVKFTKAQKAQINKMMRKAKKNSYQKGKRASKRR